MSLGAPPLTRSATWSSAHSGAPDSPAFAHAATTAATTTGAYSPSTETPERTLKNTRSYDTNTPGLRLERGYGEQGGEPKQGRFIAAGVDPAASDGFCERVAAEENAAQ
jgi:hypothetical protein